MTTEQDYRERMLRVLVYIQQHLDEALDLATLADVAHFSPFHFHRVFSGMVGEPVKQHVRRLRLERAAQRLKHTEEPVTRIAFDAGFEAHEAFTRAFRTMFGASPTEFRSAHQPVPMPPTATGVHYHVDGQVPEFHPAYEGGTPMEVTVENIDPIRVAFMRHVGPYNEVGETWQKLCGWAGPRGLLGPQMKMLGLCHDDPDVTLPEKIRYDACLVVGDNVEPAGDVGVQEIAGGEYAKALHVGPYEKLGETYAALCGQWMPQSGRTPRSSPSFEVYLNNPQTTPPEQLRTEVYMPVEPA